MQKVKYKTNKLKKLERERYSILTTRLKHCFICNKTPADIHEIYSGGNRKMSMKNGFCIPLCREHHQFATLDSLFNLRLKQLCQSEYEKTHTREEFIKLVGKNYLE